MSKMNVNLDLKNVESLIDVYANNTGLDASIMGYVDGWGLGWPQELQARIKAGSFDSPEYREELGNLEKKHQDLKDRFPVEYMGGQAAGTMTNPAVMIPGTALYKTVMGTVKSAPAFFRWLTGAATLSGEGAGLGFIEGSGRSEPGQRTEGGKFGAQLGAILGLGGSAGGAVIGKGISYLGRLRKWFNRNDLDKLGEKAIKEIEYYAAKANKTPDQFLMDVVQNKIPIIEMSDAMRDLAAMIAIRSPGARDVLTKSTTARVGQTTSNLDAQTKGDLASMPNYDAFKANDALGTTPTGTVIPENMESTVRLLNNDITNYLNKTYEKAYEGNPLAGEGVKASMTMSVDLVNRLANNLNEAVKLATKNKTPLIQISKTGDITYTRTPTLKEAETIRKVLSDEAEPALGKKRTEIQSGFKDLETDLKGEINTQSPDLKVARDSAYITNLAKEGFDSTKNIFGKQNFDKFIDEYMQAIKNASKYDENSVNLVKKYYQFGLQNELNKKLAGATRKSFIKKLNDPSTKEYKLLETLYPEGKLNQLLKRLKESEGAIAANDRLLSNSITAKDTGNVGALNSAVDEMRGGAQRMQYGDATGLGIDIVAKSIKALFGRKYGMSDSQFKLIAKFLTERRPEVAQRLMDGKFNNMVDGREIDTIAKYMVRGNVGATSAGVTGIMNPEQGAQ